MAKRYTLAALALLGFIYAVPASAQIYPSRPVRVVVPFPPGGSPDIFARGVGQRLSEAVGQPVVVENRPGANGQVAAVAVTKSAPDGYTLLIADTGQVAINPHLFAKLPYDPVKDFTPITLAMGTPLFLTVSATLPVKSIGELVALSKVRNDLRYGSSGNGSALHLGMALLVGSSGAVLEHVPYKGVAQSVPGLVAGEIHMLFVGLPAIRGHVKTGALRIIAVGSTQRTPLLPDVPTFAESGIAGFDIDSKNGFLAPAGLPRDILARLNMELNKILASEDIKNRYATMGIVVIGSTPEAYAKTIQDDLQKYAKIVKDSGARID